MLRSIKTDVAIGEYCCMSAIGSHCNASFNFTYTSYTSAAGHTEMIHLFFAAFVRILEK